MSRRPVPASHERMEQVGVSALADVELLTILLGPMAGMNSTRDAAQRLLDAVPLPQLAWASADELQQHPGIGPARAAAIAAASRDAAPRRKGRCVLRSRRPGCPRASPSGSGPRAEFLRARSAAANAVEPEPRTMRLKPFGAGITPPARRRAQPWPPSRPSSHRRGSTRPTDSSARRRIVQRGSPRRCGRGWCCRPSPPPLAARARA